ncbi:DNA cytosine methyltransferase [Cellulomonas timonensis]|uniref:DNA cytosine methyltransferase n=1 Tax=Cellulomonas timonensis TaxID=1689271 RepID=UPI00082FFBD3|nr:DNA cytosine methyltransferase [Cellulomonas timonensis]
MSTTDVLPAAKPQVLEFFAGMGLARLGLEAAGFHVAWSNDYEADKRALYQGHFRDEAVAHTFVLGDIGLVAGTDLPRGAALAWASSPCTDLSLAGGRAGLAGRESGAFWQFTRLLGELGADRPGVVVLENVVGLATSHGGADLTAAVRAFNGLGYSVDILALDARRFVPQSRPRLFLVGAQHPPADSEAPSPELRPDWLRRPFEDPTLTTHQAALPEPPALRSTGLTDLTEDLPAGDPRWWDAVRTQAFLDSLSPVQTGRVHALQRAAGVSRRTAYRRTRQGVAVWEVRADDISGCLRTARGGSSKQAVVELGGGRVRVRWMTPREYARLMGAADYDLSGARTNQALYGFGDAVAAPVVAWLATHYLRPLVEASASRMTAEVVGAAR